MRQPSLPYQPSYVGRIAWLAMLEALRAAVAHLGAKEVLFELNITKSVLSEAINEREERKEGDKRWANEWTHVVLAMLEQRHNDTCDQLARAILDAQIEVSSRFEVADVSDEPTDEQIANAERVIAAAKKRKRKRAA